MALHHPDHPGSMFLHEEHPRARPGKGKFHPVEYQPPIEEPDSDYPFVLTTGRTLYHYNSATMTMREDGSPTSRSTRSSSSPPRTPPRSASPRGTGSGSSSRRGDLRARAQISDRLYPGLVWMALHFAEAKVNWLTHDVGDFC